MKRDKKEVSKAKKTLNVDEAFEEKKTKKEKSILKNILLIISIILLIASLGICGYLYYQNTALEKEVNDSKNSIKKVQEKINSDQQEIDTKEDEYEKLKEKVKDSLEELNIWEETKENLNKSLS